MQWDPYMQREASPSPCSHVPDVRKEAKKKHGAEKKKRKDKDGGRKKLLRPWDDLAKWIATECNWATIPEKWNFKEITGTIMLKDDLINIKKTAVSWPFGDLQWIIPVCCWRALPGVMDAEPHVLRHSPLCARQFEELCWMRGYQGQSSAHVPYCSILQRWRRWRETVAAILQLLVMSSWMNHRITISDISGQGCFGGSKSTPTPGGVRLTPNGGGVSAMPCWTNPGVG